MDRADALALLRMQLDWGADEALLDAPVDRASAPAVSPAVVSFETALAAPTALAGVGALARATALAAAACDLDALARALAEPGLTALADTASHTLAGVGPAAAPLMIVADAPDDDDDRAGTPFAGEAGGLLDQMLASIGVSRDRLRLAYLVPWRPPGGRPPTDPEVAVGTVFLRRQIVLARPARLLLMGPLTARALLGRDGARRRAGAPRWRSISIETSFDAVVAPHPAAVRRYAGERRAAWAALRLVRRALDADATP